MVDVGQEHRKLVAPQPRHQVVLADAPQQPGGYLTQKLIAGIMTQRIVDGLETVQVQQEQCSSSAQGPTPRQSFFELQAEARAVRQPGQLIEVCQMFQPPLELLALERIMHGSQEFGTIEFALDDEVSYPVPHGTQGRLAVFATGEHDQRGFAQNRLQTLHRCRA